MTGAVREVQPSQPENRVAERAQLNPITYLTRYRSYVHNADMAAKRLDSFPEDEAREPRRYPWHDWTDGGVWEIRRGEDYDVETENMRANLHIRAESNTPPLKVRTKKVSDEEGEGLVFQFFHEPEQEEALQTIAAEGATATDAALELLYEDAMNIYFGAREAVEIQRIDGVWTPYTAMRYRPQIEKCEHNKPLLVPTIAGIIKKRTSGFDHLAEAGLPNLMLEALVLDETKPYHRFFHPTTLAIAKQRMQEYGFVRRAGWWELSDEALAAQLTDTSQKDAAARARARGTRKAARKTGT
jgi:hypothetical protein